MKKAGVFLLAFLWAASPVSADVILREELRRIDFSGLDRTEGVWDLLPTREYDVRIRSLPEGAAFSAQGLPEGLTLESDGRLHGASTQEGLWIALVTAVWPGGEKVRKGLVIQCWWR